MTKKVEDIDAELVADEVLFEHASLIARGVRPMAVAGYCEADELTMKRAHYRAKRASMQQSVRIAPFVLDRGDGVAEYGFAQSGWVLDLYRWALTSDVPAIQRERIESLVFGYSVRDTEGYQAARWSTRPHRGGELYGEPADLKWAGSKSR